MPKIANNIKKLQQKCGTTKYTTRSELKLQQQQQQQQRQQQQKRQLQDSRCGLELGEFKIPYEQHEVRVSVEKL